MNALGILNNLEILEDLDDLRKLGLSEIEIEGYLEFFVDEYFPKLEEQVMQYEYQCKKCGREQVKDVKLADKATKEPCEKCGAKAEYLKRVLSAHPKHGSWQQTWQGEA